jgi:hypothetical protein
MWVYFCEFAMVPQAQKNGVPCNSSLFSRKSDLNSGLQRSARAGIELVTSWERKIISRPLFQLHSYFLLGLCTIHITAMAVQCMVG